MRFRLAADQRLLSAMLRVFLQELFAWQRRRGRALGAKVSRILQRFHAHGLIAKIPRSRKRRTNRFGRRVMATSIQVKELTFPQLLTAAA
jgi:hypothetical protein